MKSHRSNYRITCNNGSYRVERKTIFGWVDDSYGTHAFYSAAKSSMEFKINAAETKNDGWFPADSSGNPDPSLGPVSKNNRLGKSFVLGWFIFVIGLCIVKVVMILMDFSRKG